MGPITYTFEELLAHKESGKVPSAAVERLKINADKILGLPTLKVIDIKLPRPSGDIHDFISMGPYWWPNPDTPDGLPWVRRDGYVNPETKVEAAPGGVYGRVRTLALAALYFPERKEEYAEYANRQMYDWFINPETKTNPHGKYLQGIPGICEGRGTGLISFGSAYVLFDGIGIFEKLGLVDGEILSGVRAWFIEFCDWILTHEYGLRMDMGNDNHASWHDANVLATAVFTERLSLQKNICLTAYESRIEALIKPDGSQPSELRRTKAMNYSCFNLEALLVVANLAERLGYSKYWGVDEKRGVCILKSAVDFIYPYIVNPESCPYEELHPEKLGKRLVKLLLSVDKRYPNEGYAERAEALTCAAEEWMLLPVL